MSYSITEYLKRREEGKLPPPSDPNCDVRTKPITDTHPAELKTIGNNPVHDDCYYLKLGKLVEKHPIVSPLRSR